MGFGGRLLRRKYSISVFYRFYRRLDINSLRLLPHHYPARLRREQSGENTGYLA